MTDIKDEIKLKSKQGIFRIVNKVQLEGIVEEFITLLGQQEDANAQWFVIRWEIAKMRNSMEKARLLIVLELLLMSILNLIVVSALISFILDW